MPSDFDNVNLRGGLENSVVKQSDGKRIILTPRSNFQSFRKERPQGVQRQTVTETQTVDTTSTITITITEDTTSTITVTEDTTTVVTVTTVEYQTVTVTTEAPPP